MNRFYSNVPARNKNVKDAFSLDGEDVSIAVALPEDIRRQHTQTTYADSFDTGDVLALTLDIKVADYQPATLTEIGIREIKSSQVELHSDNDIRKYFRGDNNNHQLATFGNYLETLKSRFSVEPPKNPEFLDRFEMENFIDLSGTEYNRKKADENFRIMSYRKLFLLSEAVINRFGSDHFIYQSRTKIEHQLAQSSNSREVYSTTAYPHLGWVGPLIKFNRPVFDQNSRYHAEFVNLYNVVALATNKPVYPEDYRSEWCQGANANQQPKLSTVTLQNASMLDLALFAPLGISGPYHQAFTNRLEELYGTDGDRSKRCLSMIPIVTTLPYLSAYDFGHTANVLESAVDEIAPNLYHLTRIFEMFDKYVPFSKSSQYQILNLLSVK